MPAPEDIAACILHGDDGVSVRHGCEIDISYIKHHVLDHTVLLQSVRSVFGRAIGNGEGPKRARGADTASDGPGRFRKILGSEPAPTMWPPNGEKIGHPSPNLSSVFAEQIFDFDCKVAACRISFIRVAVHL